MEYQERMKVLKINQVGLASKLGVSQGIISEFVSGAREPSKEFILGIYKLG
ncbi:MAG: helix-turn-helix domain-containing protein [Treponema sp.]|jgi:predicted transcriptional regulator|nr:helix-turn-helix domain-containing protein [Treponema sp.]